MPTKDLRPNRKVQYDSAINAGVQYSPTINALGNHAPLSLAIKLPSWELRLLLGNMLPLSKTQNMPKRSLLENAFLVLHTTLGFVL